MVRIPYIKIPSVRVGSIVPTSNIGTGGATLVPPTPITYLTRWQIVGNSEVHGNEIWSCGEYSEVDGKYHILVQPLGGSIADIALTEPLRKVNDVADKIEFANGTATVTRSIQSKKWNTLTINYQTFNNYDRLYTDALSGILLPTSMNERAQICLSADFTQNVAPTQANAQSNPTDQCMCVFSNGQIFIRDTSVSNASDFVTKYGEKEFLYILATATTETIEVPQIEEADSYTCEISQGAKAVEWSSFETGRE